MSISLNANFELLSAGLYLDARQQFNTIIEMKDFAETSIPDGLITYNKETQKHYVFNSSNTTHVTLGKWREYEGSNTSSAINIWQPNTEYKLKDLCLYKNTDYYSLYICTADHTSADAFVSAYWETIDGTEFEGYTEEELLDMLNLSEEELQNLQNILQPDVVSTTSTWHSSKIYAELLTVLSESKNFTIAEIAKIVSFSYKVVSSEDDVIDDKAIYLIENSSGTHDMYLLVDGSPSKVGNTSIDLSEYLKKEDIVDTFDETTIYSDSDKVFSTKAIKSMYDDLNDKKISKSNIVTTLDDIVTDEQVPSAKLYYDEKNTMLIIGDKPEHQGQSLIDIIDAKCTKNFAVYHVVFNSLVIDKPDNERCIDGYCDVYTYTPDLRKKIIVHDVTRDAIYERTQIMGVWGDWVTIFSRNNDVPKTNMTSTSSFYHFDNAFYTVIDNICYVVVNVRVIVSEYRVTGIFNLPKPKVQMIENSVPPFGTGGNSIHYGLREDGFLWLLYGDVGKNYIFSFSYPVATE